MALDITERNYFGEPGGVPYNEAAYRERALRADLCAIAQRHSYDHGAHIVDEILASYHVISKTMKEKK